MMQTTNTHHPSRYALQRFRQASAMLPFAAQQSYSQIPPSSFTTAQQNRQRMLQQVRDLWIEDALAQALHLEIQKELSIQHLPAELVKPWHFTLHQKGHNSHKIVHTDITSVYSAVHSLALVGEVGSGKSSLLLLLLRDLLEKAEQDECLPIPVLFNLSSWTEQHTSLENWLIAELQRCYAVPKQIAEEWVRYEYVLPLFDDLDALPPQMIPECIRAINRYTHAYYNQRFILCCREETYKQQRIKLAVSCTATIQPFTEQQIDAYLAAAGEKLVGLREAMRQQPLLYEIAGAPFMLNVLMHIYKNTPLEEITGSDIQYNREREILDIYVKQQLMQSVGNRKVKSQKARQFLTRIAQYMQENAHTTFQLENIQPRWLKGLERPLYLIVLTGVCIPMFFIIVSMFSALIANKALAFNPLHQGYYTWLFLGIFSLLTRGLQDIQLIRGRPWSWERVQPHLRGANTVGGIATILCAATGCMLALLTSASILHILFLGLVIGQMIWFLAILCVALTKGFASNVIWPYKRPRPGEGIRRMAFNGLRHALALGPALGMVIPTLLFFLAVARHTGRPSQMLEYFSIGLGLTLAIGFFVGFINGWYEYTRHILLRLTLWITRATPLRLTAFLDDATRHLLLRRIGGGYQFVHRRLQEHFASDPTRHLHD